MGIKEDGRNKKEEYLTKKKAIYKNKEKLKSNKVEKTEDIVYSEGMSVQALADALNVNSGELVKKLVMMGMMISVNESIDFETAEILCLDYQKSVKRAENLDITNFENYEIEDSDIKEEQALYRVYAEQKRWIADLNKLISNLNYSAMNNLIHSDFSEKRAFCG